MANTSITSEWWKNISSKVDKFNTQNPGLIGGAFSIIDNVTNSIAGNTYVDPDVQKGFNLWNGTMDIISKIPGIGTSIGGIGRGLGSIVNIIDKAAGSKVDEFNVDGKTISTIGGDYLNSSNNINESGKWSDLKFGLLSFVKKNKVQDRMNRAKQEQSIMKGISDDRNDQIAAALSMSEFSNIDRMNKMRGGPKPLKIQKGAKLDDKISFIKNLKKNLTKKIKERAPFVADFFEFVPNRNLNELFEYASSINPRFWQRIFEPIKLLDLGNGYHGTHKLGYAEVDGRPIVFAHIQEDDNGNLKDYGDMALQRALIKNDFLELNSPEEAELFTTQYKQINPNFFNPIKNDSTYQVFLNSLPENLKVETPLYRMRYAFDNSPDVWSFEDAKGKFINWDENDQLWHGSSVFAPTGEFLKSANHPSIQYELDFYNNNPEFQSEYDLITVDENGNPLEFYKYVKKQPKEFKEGGKIEETVLKNVIPEGALHKNKHHIENSDDLTLKGIPVISNDGELLAEIERDELILILEVTQKLEELKKEYKSSKKDEIAIEAGKLIIDLVLNNTDDRTNLLKQLTDAIK